MSRFSFSSNIQSPGAMKSKGSLAPGDTSEPLSVQEGT